MKRLCNLVIAGAMVLLLLTACGKRTMSWMNGTYEGEVTDGQPDGYGVWTGHDQSRYSGFWTNGKQCGNGKYVCKDSTYCGGFKDGKFSGYGILYIGDSVVYSGQWSAGRRQGHGQIVDVHGRKIEGVWNVDTLVSGERVDSTGVYRGQLSQKGEAQGHGSYLSVDGIYYEGHWERDERNAFGIEVSTMKHLRAGEWRSDRFLGERVVYSTDRIYGIDISKYQHVIKRRRYGIDWNKLRIVSLGTISKKRVDGAVNFPVSFIYIKSTEGTTIRNQFYANDYVQARKHGLRVGSYHFFSCRSNAAAQAHFFLKHSHFRKGDFPPVLDVEPTKKQIAQMGGVSAMFARIQTWLNIVEAKTGCRPILYVGQQFVNKYLSAAPYIKNNYMVWIARYGEYKPDVKLTYWQLCPDGRVSGIKGEVDINVFNGYTTQYNDFCANKTVR